MARKTQEGIACPNCGCRHNKSTNTIQSNGTFNGRRVCVTRRRRKCMHCGKGYWTVETLDPEEGGDQTVMEKPLPPSFPKEPRPKKPDADDVNPYL